jgi:hypothetical protein
MSSGSPDSAAQRNGPTPAEQRPIVAKAAHADVPRRHLPEHHQALVTLAWADDPRLTQTSKVGGLSVRPQTADAVKPARPARPSVVTILTVALRHSIASR